MPKLLYLIPDLRLGGEEKQLYLLARELHAHRVPLLVCTLHGAGPFAELLKQAGVPLEHLGGGPRWDWRRIKRFRALLRSFQPDVVHTIRPVANGVARVAVGFFSSAGLVSTLGATDAPRWRLGRNAQWIVRSPSLAASATRLGVPDKQVSFIPPGIAEARTTMVDKSSLRTALGLSTYARIIFCAGQLFPMNGFRDAVWATDILKYVLDDVQLVIAGTGLERDNLHRFARALRIGDRVHLLGDRADIPELLAIADVVWVPRQVDGIPSTLLEAMAAGRAVVANRWPGTEAAVSHGETGFLVPCGDKPALGRCTRVLLEDAALRDRLGAAARIQVAERFPLRKMIDAQLALYHKVLAKG